MPAMRTVESVLRFEDLPLGSTGSRRALVRWSDGTEGEAIRWYAERDPGLRGGPDRKDGGGAALAALPARPRLASVVGRRQHRAVIGARRFRRTAGDRLARS